LIFIIPTILSLGSLNLNDNNAAPVIPQGGWKEQYIHIARSGKRAARAAGRCRANAYLEHRQRLTAPGCIRHRGISNQGGIMRRLTLLGIAVMAGLCVGTATVRASITTDDVGPVPAATQIAYVAMSPDCSHLAMVSKLGGKAELYIDGKATTAADEIPFVVYAPDSKAMACIAVTGGRVSVVRDGVAGQPYDKVPHDSLRFSPEGQHLYYAGLRGADWYAVLDGKEHAANSKQPQQVVFSGDSRHLIYVIEDGDGKKVVIDGVAGDLQRDVIGLTVSRDGFHFAYAVEGDSLKWTAVLDGRPIGGEFARIDHFCLSPDGKHVAYVGATTVEAFAEARQQVVVNGNAGPAYYGITAGPIYSPDSGHLAYGATRVEGADGLGIHHSPVFKKSEEFQVVDGAPTPYYFANVAKLLYSAGGVLVAEIQAPPPNNAGAPVRIYRDARQLDPSGSSDGCYWNLTFDPDGKRLACAARHGADNEYDIGMDGHKLGNPGTGLGPPLFTRDGKHLAYAVQLESSWRMVLDDATESASGLVVPTSNLDRTGHWNGLTPFEDQDSVDNGHAYVGAYPYHFDPDGTLVYFRIADGHLYRVHWKPDDAATLPTTRP
jgi:hypothetical protein